MVYFEQYPHFDNINFIAENSIEISTESFDFIDEAVMKAKEGDVKRIEEIKESLSVKTLKYKLENLL
jgi:hypothetical protein